MIVTGAGALCAKLARNPPKEPRNTKYLVFLLAELSPSTGQFTAPSGIGTYQVISGGQSPAKWYIQHP